MNVRTNTYSACALWALAVALGLAGCSSPARGPAVPQALENQAVVPGFGPEVRSWGAQLNPAFLQDAVDSLAREQTVRTATGETGPLPPADFLALSGGGANGAFGAGLLCGWTAAGTRPQFKVVTGISTGALIAPFAFAGPKYDAALREVYTQTATEHIAIERGLLGALMSDSMYDTAPLKALVAKHVTAEMLADIAAEHRKGRLLVIGTTNLDADRGVLWNIGALAQRGDAATLALVQNILIASAAIPGVFPPIFITVEADGKTYQEMHVDGGTVAQVFLYPPSLKLAETALQLGGVSRERRAYIIRNALLKPSPEQVKRSLLPIVGRAVSSLIDTQGIGDLYRTYANTQRDGVDFNLAYIPDTFATVPKEIFDVAYMRELFQLGYDRAKNGYPWQKAPPLFDDEAPKLAP